MTPSRILAVVCILAGIGIYLAAVSGLAFAAATPPLDVGALSTLVVFLLFGAFAFLLDQKAAATA